MRRPFVSLAIAALALAGMPALSARAATPLSIPNQLASAVNVDKVHHTATLPIYKGESTTIGCGSSSPSPPTCGRPSGSG